MAKIDAELITSNGTTYMEVSYLFQCMKMTDKCIF